MFDRIGQLVALESCYRGSREHKGADYSGSGRTFDVFICHVKELLKSSFPSIIDGYTDLRRGKMGADGRERGLDVRGSVTIDWEGLSLSGKPDSGGQSVEKHPNPNT